MKHLAITAILGLLLISNLTATAQSPEEMKAWEAYMKPGDVHKMLAKSDGKWKEDITTWMAPGQPPAKSTGSCVNKMIMGGRYQQSNHTGKMMGMPFEGQSTLGWDNAKKMLVSTWIDNMGTGIMHMEGTWDDATKSATFKGKCTDPVTGKEMDVKEIFTIVNDNSQKMEMFMMHEGQEMKTMEIVFTRAK
jgi:hypothetical protein